MKMQIALAILLSLSTFLCACTTTKDLERHPEMVAVAASSKESGSSPNKNPAESAKEQKPTVNTVVPTTEGEAKPDAPPTSSQPNAMSPVREQKPGEAAAPTTSAPAVIVEKKIYIEKPIYYPDVPQALAKPGETVANASAQGVMKPKDYNGAMILYDYDEKLVYEVFTMPLRVTDLYLEPGEKVIEQPFCGDTTRWSIGGGVSKTGGVDTQHLYLKPSEEGLETTLIINTERRIYHLIIKSFKDTYMLAVMWRYRGLGMPYDFLSQEDQRKNTPEQGKTERGSN